jgi:uncharacterized protein YbjT (DUF2867 family)
MTRTLVIDATGNIGREVVLHLAANDLPVRALTRKSVEAWMPPQVEVVQGDLTSPESLDGCLAGIDAVFLVWTAPLDAFGAALERIAKHAQRIVFLSAPLKTPHPFFQQPNPSRTQTEQIERMIETSQLDWTFLRPGMLASNSRHWWGRPRRVLPHAHLDSSHGLSSALGLLKENPKWNAIPLQCIDSDTSAATCRESRSPYN